jgi:hypothetical protein
MQHLLDSLRTNSRSRRLHNPGPVHTGVATQQRAGQISSSRRSSVVAHAVQAPPAPAAAEELSRVFYEQGMRLQGSCGVEQLWKDGFTLMTNTLWQLNNIAMAVLALLMCLLRRASRVRFKHALSLLAAMCGYKAAACGNTVEDSNALGVEVANMHIMHPTRLAQTWHMHSHHVCLHDVSMCLLSQVSIRKSCSVVVAGRVSNGTHALMIHDALISIAYVCAGGITVVATKDASGYSGACVLQHCS